RFFTVRCNPADPPATINIYGFKMGRDYITSAQTLPIEQESACYTGPVCLLHGTWDGIIPIACSEWYHQLYPRSEFHRIRCTGHVFLLRRKLLRSHVLDFLRNLPAPRATDNDAS
ncbi:MAG: alpha/beta hydrolase, partial [Bacteroidales bacterium]|nr:alpha/beta hydrolase [Bacteroidales bacterium]